MWVDKWVVNATSSSPIAFVYKLDQLFHEKNRVRFQRIYMCGLVPPFNLSNFCDHWMQFKPFKLEDSLAT